MSSERADYTAAAAAMMRYLVGCGLATATVAGPVEDPMPVELDDDGGDWDVVCHEDGQEKSTTYKAGGEMASALNTAYVCNKHLDRRCYVEFCLGDSCATVCWDDEACYWKTIEDWGQNMVLSACCEHLVTVLNNSMQRG